MYSLARHTRVHPMSDQPGRPPKAPGTAQGTKPKTTPGTHGAKEALAKPRSKSAVALENWLNSNFSGVFSSTHWVYTLIFFIMAIFIAILRFFDGSLLFALYVATSLVFTFFILFVIASSDASAPLVVQGSNLKKLLLFLLLFGISVGISVLAFYGSENFPVQYQFETMLPVLYMLIFFGWNVIQIFFIKKGLEDISTKVEQKVFKGETSSAGKNDKGVAFLVLGILVPAGMLAGVIALLFYDDTSSGFLLWNHPIGQVVFIAWIAAMVLLIGASSFNALVLYRQTVKHETPSVFSSIVHMLFLVYILFRSYQFINAAGKSFQDPAQQMSWANDLLDACIMVLTLLLLFKGLGSKLSRASLFSKNNLPFMTFLFSTVVIMGNMVLILGINVGGSAVKMPQALVSAINGFMMMAVAVIYYFSYLKRALMQRNQLEKDNYSLHEVQKLFVEYTDTIAGRFATEKAGLRAELERFLLSHEIDVPTYSPEPPATPKTSGAALASPTPATSHGKKASFFDGIASAETEPGPKSPAAPAEEKPVVSKYPLEQPKKVDDDGDTK